MKEKNLDRRPQELQESKGKKKNKNNIEAAVLIATLAIGFYFSAWAIQEIKAAEVTAATTQAEMQHQVLECHEQLIEPQAKLDELQAKPSETITIEVPVIAEMEEKVPQKFREFKDLSELTEWLKNNSLPIRIIAGEDGRIDLTNPRSTSQYDCDDYAEDLQIKALEQGLLMSQQLLMNGQIYGIKVSEYTEPHMGNLAVIGNNIYYVESMPPHNVVRITSRD